MNAAAVLERGLWRAARVPLAIALAGLALLGLISIVTGGSASGPIVVSLNASLATTLAPGNLAALQRVEQQISVLPNVTSVAGPASVIARGAVQADHQIASQLARPANARSGGPAHRLDEVLVRDGYTGMPSLHDDSFVGQFVFGNGVGPRRALAWLFPDSNHARLIVRLRGGLGGGQLTAMRRRILQIIESANLIGVQPRIRVGS